MFFQQNSLRKNQTSDGWYTSFLLGRRPFFRELSRQGLKQRGATNTRLSDISTLAPSKHLDGGKAFQGKKILLLQGPVGDFFRELNASFIDAGAQVQSIGFNAADSLFGPKSNRFDFHGDIEEWRVWLSHYLVTNRPDAVVLFGSDRPVHCVARELASRLNVDVWCLEEGYVRPGLITMELGGNNSNSPLAGMLPDEEWQPDLGSDTAEAHDFQGFCDYSIKSAMYYVSRTFLTFGRRKALFHKRFSPLVEVFHWARNVYRRWQGGESNFAIIQRLLEHHDGKYFIVPLQIARDCNMKGAAMGWNSPRLIEESVRSFAKSADPRFRLVFKIHPLERGHSDWKPLIRKVAESYGVADRVDVVDIGSLGLLTRHSAGMITVTSTSGLSAIHHGVPLMVVGSAVYANPVLATCANGNPDFDRFWSCRDVAPELLRRRYGAWLREKALLPGDFYAKAGIEVGCRSVVGRLQAHWAGAADIRKPAVSVQEAAESIRNAVNAKNPKEATRYAPTQAASLSNIESSEKTEGLGISVAFDKNAVASAAVKTHLKAHKVA